MSDHAPTDALDHGNFPRFLLESERLRAVLQLGLRTLEPGQWPSAVLGRQPRGWS